jgi:trans-aconitate 2-methyltransferase
MTQDTWNPQQYERFRDERSQPFYDLLALVRVRAGMRVVDLGCGTGELTAAMHRRLQARETVGVDSSQAMLAKSAGLAADGLRFVQGDIAAIDDVGVYDLVLSNAALHWLDGHDELLARLTRMLVDGGQLAVQVPANFDHPSHTVAHELAAESPFGAALSGPIRSRPVLPPEEYAALLYRLGYREQHVRLQVYGHQLASRDDVIEWVKGTLLTDYQRRLPAELWPRFLESYRERLLSRLDDTRPYFYPFKRILFWGQR